MERAFDARMEMGFYVRTDVKRHELLAVLLRARITIFRGRWVGILAQCKTSYVIVVGPAGGVIARAIRHDRWTLWRAMVDRSLVFHSVKIYMPRHLEPSGVAVTLGIC